MKTLRAPNGAFAHDRGDPDPALRAVLAEAYDGGTHYATAVAALCAARLLLPIVASGDDHGDGPDPTRRAEMAAVLVKSEAGATAVPVFTGIDALQAWNPQARPVPCTLDDVAATVLETKSQAILVDLPGPHPVVIELGIVEELAQGRRLVGLPDGGFGWMYLDPGHEARRERGAPHDD